MTHQDGCGAEHGTSCASHLQQRGSCKELSKGHRFEEIETLLLQKSQLFAGFLHPRWCRISSINSMKGRHPTTSARSYGMIPVG